MNEDRIIGALLAAAGGKIEVPWGVLEQIPAFPLIRTWRTDGLQQSFVWALDGPGMQEIQAREAEAYALARETQRQEDLQDAVDALTTKLLRGYRELPLDAPFLDGFVRAIELLREQAGLSPAPDGGPRADIVAPFTPGWKG